MEFIDEHDPAATHKRKNTLTRSNVFFKIASLRNTGILVLLIGLWIALSFLSPYFFDSQNVVNILQQSTLVAISGVGMTLVIITGGIDLSVGSVAALTGMVVGILVMNVHLWFLWALMLGLMVGAVAGLLNGLLVTRFRLQPMVVTLGMMTMARGLTLISTSGRPVFVTDSTIIAIGNGTFLGFPIQVCIAIAAAVIASLLLNLTFYGRYVFSIGGNEEATRLSGVPVSKYKVITYVISGLFSSIVGIVMVGLLGSSEPTVGFGLELDSIAVAAIGGTSLMGGVGGIGGTMLGALLIGTLKNGLTILDIVSYYQQVLIGVVIIVAVTIDSIRQRNQQ